MDIAKRIEELNETAVKTLVDHRDAIDRLTDRVEGIEAMQDAPRPTAGVSREQDQYKGAFLDYLRKPADKHFEKHLTEAAHDLSKKDASIATPSSGGYGVPEEISRQIARQAVTLNPAREYIRVDQCGTGDYHVLLDRADSTASWSSETGTRSATTTPTLRDRVPTFGEQYALMTSTEWLLDDAFFNVEDWLVQGAARQFAAAEIEAIVNGSGSNRPTGFLNSTPVTTADDASPERDASTLQYIGLSGPASPAVLNYDSIVDLVHTLKTEYLLDPSCAFFAHRTTVGQLRQIKDSNGNPIWQESIQAGIPPRLLGYPVVIVDSMPTYAADAFAIAFGAWNRAYVLADRVGLRVTADPYSTPGEVRFYVRRRLGGTVLDNAAAKILRISD